MKTRITFLVAILLVAAVSVASAEIRGNYLEARNAEVYASHCFANSEMGIRGDLAVMAWEVEQGGFNGVSLDGLGVVAVIRASSTLGDPFSNPYPVKSVLIFDERASEQQRAALAAFAKRSGGELLNDVVRTEVAPLSFDFHGNIHARRATMAAGDLVRIETRAIKQTDSLCHLDDLYYAPLVSLEHAMPAFALENSFEGDGLGVHFSAPRRSSAYLGQFELGTVTTD